MSLTICLSSSSVEGLHAIVVTDRDGVPVIKGTQPTTRTDSIPVFSHVLGHKNKYQNIIKYINDIFKLLLFKDINKICVCIC